MREKVIRKSVAELVTTFGQAAENKLTKLENEYNFTLEELANIIINSHALFAAQAIQKMAIVYSEDPIKKRNDTVKHFTEILLNALKHNEHHLVNKDYLWQRK